MQKLVTLKPATQNNTNFTKDWLNQMMTFMYKCTYDAGTINQNSLWVIIQTLGKEDIII